MILATGTMVLQSVAAAEALEVQGIRCTVVNCRFLKPYDRTVFEQIGGFDPDVFPVEDYDLSFRLFNFGHCVFLKENLSGLPESPGRCQ